MEKQKQWKTMDTNGITFEINPEIKETLSKMVYDELVQTRNLQGYLDKMIVYLLQAKDNRLRLEDITTVQLADELKRREKVVESFTLMTGETRTVEGIATVLVITD